MVNKRVGKSRFFVFRDNNCDKMNAAERTRERKIHGMSQIESEIFGRCKWLVYRPFPCSADPRTAGKRLTLMTRAKLVRETEREEIKRRKENKERKERCIPTFEYVSMHILPSAIGKDFREIPKSRNSRRVARSSHSGTAIPRIIVIRLYQQWQYHGWSLNVEIFSTHARAVTSEISMKLIIVRRHTALTVLV